MTNLSVNVQSGPRCVFRVAGELDLLSADLFVELALINLEVARVAALVIDLGGVTFVDGRGLRALLTLRDAARRAGKTVSVADPHPKVRALLAMTGLEELLEPQPVGTDVKRFAVSRLAAVTS